MKLGKADRNRRRGRNPFAANGKASGDQDVQGHETFNLRQSLPSRHWSRKRGAQGDFRASIPAVSSARDVRVGHQAMARDSRCFSLSRVRSCDGSIGGGDEPAACATPSAQPKTIAAIAEALRSLWAISVFLLLLLFNCVGRPTSVEENGSG